MTNTKVNASGKRVRGEQRTTREDWVQTALDTLVSDGVDSVKVSVLADKLNCARSSFYWYFKNRRHLLEGLLEHWQATNTQAILYQATRAADTINFALVNLFSCWVSSHTSGERLFDTQLDFAVREWARRDGSIRRAVDQSDAQRIDAISDMFTRYGFDPKEARIRARIVYFTQIGYEALDTRESNLERAQAGRLYLKCHTGIVPTEDEVRAIVQLTGHDMSEIEGPV